MRVENQVAFLEGPVTQIEARRLLAEGDKALASGCAVIDLAGVEQVDSSALSLLLAWRRSALQANRSLVFHNIPKSLHSLVDLYGVGELLADG